MRMQLRLGYFMMVLLVAGALRAPAQSLAQRNAAKRYEINAKRSGVDPKKAEALPASREFIRIDSTYYVGWMFQGMYLNERAADYLGFKNAADILEKALDLLENDYKPELRTRTNDVMVYFKVYPIQMDYSQIAYTLFHCYQNSEQNEKSYALLRRVQRWNMQRNFFLEPYTMLAWITHRNRFYTSHKYPFLKNSIPDNEELAHSYLDSALYDIKRNAANNQTIFQPGYDTYEYLSNYHYRCILYAYALNIDSANHYFGLMENTAAFPYNNYATFCAIQANFRAAEENYMTASAQDAGDKRLQEWAYYTSILDIYKGKPLVAAINMRDMIKAVGSTPGFGWYNIALARACSYEGNLAESNKYADRAAHFKELHIGTTLGQTHYEFSVNLIKLLNKSKSIAQVKFEDKNWWWHPGSLLKILRLQFEKYLQQYLLVNQFAMNPERDMVIYKIFSTESTVSWDEVWFLVRDFSTNFFRKKFAEELKQDKREKVYKYYNLFLAKLEMKKGHYQKAQDLLQKTLSFGTDIDEEFEKLYLARALEALAICAEKTDNAELHDRCLGLLYSIYPQLLPFSELKPAVKLQVQGDDKGLLRKMKKYRIDWQSDSKFAPRVQLVFGKEGQKDIVTIETLDFEGKKIVTPTKIILDGKDASVRDVVYGLFNIQSLDAQADVEDRG